MVQHFFIIGLWAVTLGLFAVLLSKKFWQKQAVIETIEDSLKTSLQGERQTLLHRLAKKPLLRPGIIFRKLFFKKNLAEKLLNAGGPLTPEEYLVLKKIICIAGVGYLLLLSLNGNGTSEYFLPILIVLISFFIPDLWIKTLKDRRLAKMKQEVPYFIDMLTLTLESGMNLEQALIFVVERQKGVLNGIMKKEMRAMDLGETIEHILKKLSEKIPVEDFSNFVRSILESKKLGTSLNQTLSIQSELIHTRQVQRAEEIGRTSSVKITFPLVLFIFPALLIIFLGPAIVQVAGGI
jgi:tight adherence protein C